MWQDPDEPLRCPKGTMILSGMNLVMTVIGFAVSTMFIVFVCTRLICARIHLSASRRSFRTATDSDLSNLERGLYGLEPAVVTGFPTQKFGDQFFSSGQDTQCTICLAEYQDEDVLRLLPFCGHAFHVACIDLWLKQHSTCPLCRISLRDSPDRKCTMEPVYSSPIRSPPETSSLELYHFLHAQHVDSARIADNQRLETTWEDQFISEPSGAMEAASPEVNCSSKITCPHASKNT